MAKRPAKTLYERIQHADEMAGRYLGDANELDEAGHRETAKLVYEKAQFWLDRYNLLTGNGEKAPPKR